MSAAKHTPAPLTRTDIARCWRESYGGQRMDSTAEDFARRVEHAAMEEFGATDLLAALQKALEHCIWPASSISAAEAEARAAIAKATGEGA